MKKTQQKLATRTRRHARIRARIVGTEEKPRLAVFRSNTAVYAQLIDDVSGRTFAAADSRKVKADTPLLRSSEVGQEIAKQAQKKGITSVVFDRGGFQYTGVVKAVAEGARAGGLKF